jgi:hypothetical protein
MAIGRKRKIVRAAAVSAAYGYRKQLLTLSAANLDRPAPPLGVNFDTQFKRNELRQLKRPFSHGKNTHPEMALRVLRVHKRDAVLGHSGPGVSRPKGTVTKTALMLSYTNS